MILLSNFENWAASEIIVMSSRNTTFILTIFSLDIRFFFNSAMV